jgi:hypothetical protein
MGGLVVNYYDVLLALFRKAYLGMLRIERYRLLNEKQVKINNIEKLLNIPIIDNSCKIFRDIDNLLLSKIGK